MQTLKEILKYPDLYGNDILLQELKKQFSIVSWAKNSTPTPGSRSWPIQLIKAIKPNVKILKPIFHRNGDLTLITTKGHTKYSK